MYINVLIVQGFSKNRAGRGGPKAIEGYSHNCHTCGILELLAVLRVAQVIEICNQSSTGIQMGSAEFLSEMWYSSDYVHVFQHLAYSS